MHLKSQQCWPPELFSLNSSAVFSLYVYSCPHFVMQVKILIGGPDWLQEQESSLCQNTRSWVNTCTGETVVTVVAENACDAGHADNDVNVAFAWSRGRRDVCSIWHPSAVAYAPRVRVCPSHSTTPATFGYTPMRAPIAIASTLLHPACVAFKARTGGVACCLLMSVGHSLLHPQT